MEGSTNYWNLRHLPCKEMQFLRAAASGDSLTSADECESLSPRYTLCTQGFQGKHDLPLKKCSTLVMFRAMFSFSGESPGKGGYVNEPEPPLTLNRLFSYDGIPGNHQ